MICFCFLSRDPKPEPDPQLELTAKLDELQEPIHQSLDRVPAAQLKLFERSVQSIYDEQVFALDSEYLYHSSRFSLTPRGQSLMNRISLCLDPHHAPKNNPYLFESQKNSAVSSTEFNSWKK